MDNDFRQTDEGGGRSLDGDNVVRFPRDWLGPREELIPFGPAAYAAGDEGHAESGTSPTAHDFWGGEGLGSAHDAPQAPACSDQPAMTGRARRLSRAGARGRRFPLPGTGGRRSAGAGWRGLGRARLLSISVLGLAVTAVLATLVLRSAAQRPPERSLPAAQAGGVAARSGLDSVGSQPVHGRSVIALESSAGKRSGSSSRPRNHRRGAERPRRRAAVRVGTNHPSSRPVQTQTPTVQPVRYASPPAAPGGTTSSPPSSPAPPPSPAPPSSPAPPASPPPEPTATVSSGGGGQASGAKQPIWGQNGSLAVGHGVGTG